MEPGDGIEPPSSDYKTEAQPLDHPGQSPAALTGFIAVWLREGMRPVHRACCRGIAA